jgi:D-glycero-D-manno-heptose 1,7-bisphosphate phosphatase
VAESGRPLIVLDRDGVINEDSDAYIKSAEEWHAIPSSIVGIAHLVTNGFDVVVASNQSGLGRGLFDRASLQAIHAKMVETIEAGGGWLAGIYICPHRPDDGCDCRKPRTGMLRRIERDFAVSLVGVPFVGDKQSDLDTAAAVRARAILVRTGRGSQTEAGLTMKNVEVFDNLAAAAAALVAEKHDRHR